MPRNIPSNTALLASAHPTLALGGLNGWTKDRLKAPPLGGRSITLYWPGPGDCWAASIFHSMSDLGLLRLNDCPRLSSVEGSLCLPGPGLWRAVCTALSIRPFGRLRLKPPPLSCSVDFSGRTLGPGDCVRAMRWCWSMCPGTTAPLKRPPFAAPALRNRRPRDAPRSGSWYCPGEGVSFARRSSQSMSLRGVAVLNRPPLPPIRNGLWLCPGPGCVKEEKGRKEGRKEGR